MPTRSLRAGSAATLALALVVPAGGAVAQDSTSITFLTPPWGVPNADLLAAFEEGSGIDVELLERGQTEDLFTTVRVAAAAGEPAADVILLTEEAPSNIVATRSVEPIDDLIEAAGSDLGEFAQVDFWQIGGATYAIPVYSQLVMMDYNAATLAEGGFDSGPTTWAELDEMARSLKGSGVDPNPIAFGAIDWSWYLMALSMGDPMFDDRLYPVFADEGSKAREAMAMLLGWFADEVISPGIIGTSHDAAFWEGTGTFHQGWQGSLDVANDPERSVQAPDVEYLLLPDEHFTWSFPAGVGIGIDSQDREAAYEFIEWYTSPETQKSIYEAFGLYPSRPAVAAELDEAGAIAGYDVIVEQSRYLNELPRDVLWWGPFTAEVRSAISEAATAGSDPDAVVDELARAWKELMAEYAC